MISRDRQFPVSRGINNSAKHNVMIITKYKTIVGATTLELDRAVNELLQEGYALYGNPYTNGDAVNGLVLCQAMVVNESPDPDAETNVTAASLTPD
jgi:hypothetical protein